MNGTWYDTRPVGNGITLIREGGVRMYLVEGGRDVAVIDTGFGIGDLAGLVRTISNRQPLVLQTHAHPDHIGNSHQFDRVHVSPRDADDLRRGIDHDRYVWLIENFVGDVELPAGFDLGTASVPGTDPTGYLNHGETIDIGDRVLEIYETPGHAPGGVSILDRTGRALFVGDVIAPDILLCLPHSDPNAYRKALDTLAEVADHADQVFSGHCEPLGVDRLRQVHDAFTEIWGGRNPDAQQEVDFGKKVPAGVYDFGEFRFTIDLEKLAEARREHAAG